MYYYKVGNAPYQFPVSVEDYFAHYETNEKGEQVKIPANTDCYEPITEAEFKRLNNVKEVRNDKLVEMDAIQLWLKDHDYLINKHSLGELSDTDKKWTSYLAERKTKLDRYKELEASL